MSATVSSAPRGTRLAAGAFAPAVATLLAAFAALLLWNAVQYPWDRGYDASSLALYTQAVQQGRLPSQGETPAWHNPPLFFVLAGGVQGILPRLGYDADPREAVQFGSVAAALAVALFAFLVARELFPGSRLVQLAVLGFAVTTPVLARAGVQYHPEALAAALVAAGTWLLVRALVRRRLAPAAAGGAGMAIGFANLTRTWALAALLGLGAALVLHWLRTRERRALVAAGAFAGVALALTGPWLAYKALAHGSPLAYSRPVPEQWVLEGRPEAFYVGLPVAEVFGRPYAPHLTNLLLPVSYTDWWGDYWRYYGVPESMINGPERLPPSHHRPRVLQSFVGVLPSVLIVAGIVGLGAQAVRRRCTELAVVLLPLLALGAAFVWFLTGNPKVDGDNIKALYVLNGTLPAALGGGWALAKAQRAGPVPFAVLVGLLLVGAAVTARFLLLPPA